MASIAAAKKSCTTGKCITKVGLSNVCTHDQDGNEDKNPVFPYKFHFDLTGEVNFSEEKPSSMEVFLEQFKVKNDFMIKYLACTNNNIVGVSATKYT